MKAKYVHMTGFLTSMAAIFYIVMFPHEHDYSISLLGFIGLALNSYMLYWMHRDD